MVPKTILALAAASTTVSAFDLFRSNNQAFLSTDLEMQPDVVARTLSHVEEEWKAQAQAFIGCELGESQEQGIKDCDDTPQNFGKSCATVVSAVVHGSSGDPKVMNEYMGDVCSQKVMANWHQTTCNALAQAISTQMTSSSYDNRINFQNGKVCDGFWTSFLAEQKTLHEQELVAIKEQQKKAEEAAEEKAKEDEENVKTEELKEEEAAKANEEKEQEEMDAERKLIAVRANRTDDVDLKARVEKVEEEAASKIAEATKAEHEATKAEQEANATKDSVAQQANAEYAKQKAEIKKQSGPAKAVEVKVVFLPPTPAKAEVAKPAAAKAVVAQPAAAKAIVAQPAAAKAVVAAPAAKPTAEKVSVTTKSAVPAATKA